MRGVCREVISIDDREVLKLVVLDPGSLPFMFDDRSWSEYCVVATPVDGSLKEKSRYSQYKAEGPLPTQMNQYLLHKQNY